MAATHDFVSFGVGSIADYVSTHNVGSALIRDTILHSAVPVPAAVWLFSSGLIGLVALTRRKT